MRELLSRGFGAEHLNKLLLQTERLPVLTMSSHVCRLRTQLVQTTKPPLLVLLLY